MEDVLGGEISLIISDFLRLLPDGAGEVVGEGGSISAIGPDRLISEITSILTDRGGEVISFFLLLLGSAVLLALVGMLPERMLAAEVGVSILLSALLLSRLYPLFDEVLESLSRLNSLFGTVMPTVVALLSVGGGVTLAPTASVGMQITLYLAGIFSSGLMMRVVIAMLVAGSFSEVGGTAERLSRSIKEIFTKLVGISVATLGGIIALETYIASVSDGAIIRMARLAAGNMIPIVGSAVSGALGTLAGGISYASGVVGAGSVAAILSVALSPIVILLGYRAAFGVVGFLVSFLPRGRGTALFSAFSGALDALLSVYVMTTIIYIFEIIALMMGGGSLAR